MTEGSSIARPLAIGLVTIGVVSGLWFAMDPPQSNLEALGEAPNTPALEQGALGEAPNTPAPEQGAIEIPSPVTLTPEAPLTPPADHHIERGGRLSISAPGADPASE